MEHSDCFHEVCHLWAMVEHLGYDYGRACIAYDDGNEGMLTVEGFNFTYNDFNDLEDAAKFIIAGVVGDKINNQLSKDDNIYQAFSSHYSYGKDFPYYIQLHNTATGRHNLKTSAEDWFDELFEEMEGFFDEQDLDELEQAATELLENGEYILSTNDEG